VQSPTGIELERTMGSGTNAKTGQVRIVTSKDRLQAWLELPRPGFPGFSPPSEEDLISVLTEKEIELTDAVRERVRQYLEIISGASQGDADGGPPEVPQRFLIAEGRAAVDAKNGEFEWDEAFSKRVQDWQGDAPVNYYTMNSVVTIEFIV
jgi:hypothetical protein